MAEHSRAWLELMSAYQEFREKMFYWAKEDNDVKYHDLAMELGVPILERDLIQRLQVLNLLKNTDMWDTKAILLVHGELTQIALSEQEEAAAYARMVLKKVKHCPERIEIADKVLTLAAAEERQEKPDYEVFHNGYMLLCDLGCREYLQPYIDQYKDFIYLASGLEEKDLKELAEQVH